VEGYPDEGYYDMLANGALVEGIVLKAAWHWGSDCCVINDPVGGPGCTPFYVALPST
jgi:hypothetical protein